MTVGIYKIINQKTGDTYIGSSKNIEQRVLQQLRPSSSNFKDHLINFTKNCFKAEILEICPKDHLLANEQKWMDVLLPTLNKSKWATGQSRDNLKTRRYEKERIEAYLKANKQVIPTKNTKKVSYKKKTSKKSDAICQQYETPALVLNRKMVNNDNTLCYVNGEWYISYRFAESAWGTRIGYLNNLAWKQATGKSLIPNRGGFICKTIRGWLFV